MKISRRTCAGPPTQSKMRFESIQRTLARSVLRLLLLTMQGVKGVEATCKPAPQSPLTAMPGPTERVCAEVLGGPGASVLQMHSGCGPNTPYSFRFPINSAVLLFCSCCFAASAHIHVHKHVRMRHLRAFAHPSFLPLWQAGYMPCTPGRTRLSLAETLSTTLPLTCSSSWSHVISSDFFLCPACWCVCVCVCGACLACLCSFP